MQLKWIWIFYNMVFWFWEFIFSLEINFCFGKLICVLDADWFLW